MGEEDGGDGDGYEEESGVHQGHLASDVQRCTAVLVGRRSREEGWK
jgi:hypothetical protein